LRAEAGHRVMPGRSGQRPDARDSRS
jgi:hypothetical protein